MPVDNSSKYTDKALCIFPRDENKTKCLKIFEICQIRIPDFVRHKMGQCQHV